MFEMLSKKRNQKGFTLIEMLIVVAIIAILVAIAVPTFSSQLEKAKVATDKDNLRSAMSLAVSDYLSEHQNQAADEDVVFAVYKDTNSNLIVFATGGTGVTLATPCTQNGGTAPAATSALKGASNGLTGTALTVTVTGGKVTAYSWSGSITL